MYQQFGMFDVDSKGEIWKKKAVVSYIEINADQNCPVGYSNSSFVGYDENCTSMSEDSVLEHENTNCELRLIN